MKTSDQILKYEQKLNRHQSQLNREKLKQRKSDTRRKIELGGLVIKANMDNFSKAVILGALLDSIERLNDEPHFKVYFQSKGEAGFMGY